jgi:hypothetical protein
MRLNSIIDRLGVQVEAPGRLERTTVENRAVRWDSIRSVPGTININ